MKVNIGIVLQERFEVRANLGEGGFATVYRAYDNQLGREVALKVLKLSADPELLSRFQREAKLLAKLAHKHIVSVYSFGTLDDSTPYIAMELLEGVCLQQLLLNGSRLKLDEIYSILNQACQALSYAHNNGVVHRDLSPANIFLLNNKSETFIKLLDFGLSKVFADESKMEASMTATGILIGNPLYMSPELARGMKADLRTDIYSLGTVIYQCLSGNEPFQSDTPLGLIYQQQQCYPSEPQSDETSERSELLKSMILRCIQKDPDRRFQSCDDILQSLQTGKMPNGSEIKQGLDSWADARRKSGFDRNSAPLKFVISVALACGLILIALQTEPAQKAIASTLKMLNSATLIELEDCYANALLKAHKLPLAKDMYEHLSSLYHTSGDRRHEAKCLLSVAQINFDMRDKDFMPALERLFELSEQIPESSAKSQLLSLIFKIIQEAPDNAIDETVRQRFMSAAFCQMVQSNLHDKAELRRCFDAIMQKDVTIFSPDKEADAVISYIERDHPSINSSETSCLDYLSDHCSDEIQERLWRARLTIGAYSGESMYRVKYGLATCRIMRKKPQEAIEILRSARQEQSDILDNSRAWFREAEIEYSELHDYEAALKSAGSGLRVVASAPLIGYHRSRNRRCVLYTKKIECLFKLGRIEEMKQCSKRLLDDLIAAQPDNSLSQDDTSVIEDTISQSVGDSGKSFDELLMIYEHDGIFPVLDCFIDTQQLSDAKSLLSFFRNKMKTSGWKLDHKSIARLQQASQKVTNPQLAEMIKEMLSSKAFTLPKRFNVPD